MVGEEAKVTPIEEENLSKGMLDSNAAFVLDCETEIFVWHGRFCSFLEKRTAIMLAEEFVQMFERPTWTPIIRVRERAEPALFKNKFIDWFDAPVSKATQSSRIAVTREQLPIDVNSLHLSKPVPEPVLKIEESSDCIELWNIESNSKALPISEEEFGIFFTNKSYICLFSYIELNKDLLKSFAYFWEGSQAKTQNYIAYKFGFYDILDKKMKEEGGSSPVQVKINEGKEPENFLELFNKEHCVIIRRVTSTFFLASLNMFCRKDFLFHVCSISNEEERKNGALQQLNWRR